MDNGGLPRRQKSSMPTLRIATRRSQLALWQANHVADLLRGAHPGLEVELVPMVTQGDRIQDRALAEVGGKGLFIKELEVAMAEDRADLAVHSMKDVPADLPSGYAIACVLPRADPRDAFLSVRHPNFCNLPPGARIGTSSQRRQCILRSLRPDLRILPLRGNVDTRLAWVSGGEVDATLLAMAGLRRLGKPASVGHVIETDVFLPAVAQGAIGVETRSANAALREMLDRINDCETHLAVSLEREFLTVLDGSCKTPIAGYARAAGDGRMRFEGCALSPDGRQRFDVARLETVADLATAEAVGRAAGAEMLARAGQNFFRV